MQKVLIFVISLMLTSTLAYAQADRNILGNASAYTSIPKEKVFVHHTTAVVFPGEYIYYSFYCLDEKKHTPSQLSKVGYVDVVNEERQVISHQKIKLTNGRGQGDYFVATNIPSGNYKIVAYTQWMRNNGVASFFTSDLTILNPYLGNQQQLILKTETTDSLITQEDKSSRQLEFTSKSEKGFQLEMDQKTYRKRQRATVTFNTELGTIGYGNFSLSVRKIAPHLEQERFGAKAIVNTNIPPYNGGDEALFLPEVRGSLLAVNVVSKTRDRLQNLNVSMSIPGKNYVFKIANSNEDGTAYFNLNDNYEGNTAIFQILDANTMDYQLVLKNEPPIDYSDLDFKHFELSKEMANAIVERSVRNQIENAFVDAKKDTILEEKFNLVFDYSDAVRYKLDDYTRFKTVKETMVEIVKDVWTKKNANKDDVFQVRWTGSDLASVVLPLLILDGMVVQNHQLLVDYDARKIASIHVLQGTYILGEMVYDGVLVFESIDPIDPDDIDFGELLKMELLNPEVSKIYFNPKYDDSNQAKLQRIPDYREQLFWKPKIRLNKDEVTFEFYTSDVSGTFVMELQGFTDSGRPVSLSKFMYVK